MDYMNCMELIQSWKNPKNYAKCSCRVISTQKQTTLYPGIVNQIVIPFKGCALTDLMKVIVHKPDHPAWHIISDYIFFNQDTHSLTIPVISSALQTLPIAEPICHVQQTTVVRAVKARQGNL